MFDDAQLRFAARVATGFVATLWLVKLLETVFGLSLYQWGVYPRSLEGMPGVAFAPLIHGSWQHLFANTLPLWVLGTALLYGYPKSRWWALFHIWWISGLGVWLFGRPSVHIGASGLAHGMFFFLFMIGILRRDKRAVALLMIAFFLYGSMLLTILPQAPAVSFEAHAFGALGGVISALWFRRRDPAPARTPYDWELDDERDSPTPGEKPDGDGTADADAATRRT